MPLEGDDSSLPGPRDGSRRGVHRSPSLARGDARVNDVLIDIYALGVILYEVLTGQVPFSGTGIVNLIRKILDEKPKPPRKIAKSIPAALESICLKAMSKQPSDRYATAGELAIALQSIAKPSQAQRLLEGHLILSPREETGVHCGPRPASRRR